jgi:cell division transport system permease protein
VFARRAEIEVMRLVGATAWFIRWPFVVEGGLTGAVAAGIALAVVTAAYFGVAHLAAGAVPFLSLPPPWEVAADLAWKLTLWGVLIGFTASFLALRRFLAL